MRATPAVLCLPLACMPLPSSRVVSLSCPSLCRSSLEPPALATVLQLRRTIVVEEAEAPPRTQVVVEDALLRKRRLTTSDEQSVKFAEDEDPALASPPKGAKRAPPPAIVGGKPAVPLAQRLAPAVAPAPRQPERQPAAARLPRQPERPAEPSGIKPEKIDFPPPKPLGELRKVSRRQCAGQLRTSHLWCKLIARNK